MKSEDIKSKKNGASRAPIDRQLHLTCLLSELRPSVSDFPSYLLNAVYFSLLTNNLKTVIKKMFIEYTLYFANQYFLPCPSFCSWISLLSGVNTFEAESKANTEL